ncbi:prp 4 C domain-containing protein [Rutstroemia sp. NJR-2017a WRK4]|nr:prp 4 C domain-containing protein [Rutstroemia sp. NJR-2017a WRK4]
MYFTLVTIASVLAVASATAEPKQPYMLAARSLNREFDFSKRQAGYDPSDFTSSCGSGATCAEACGAGYETCPSTDGSLDCFSPTKKETCCPYGTGDSCSDGYYCAQYITDRTVWCCPDGMDLAACAKAYSLAGPLQTTVPTPAPVPTLSPIAPIPTTATGASSSSVKPSSTSVKPSSTSVKPSSTSVKSSTSSVKSSTTSVKPSTTATTPVGTVSPTKPGNGTIAPTSTLTPFTGMAAGRADSWVAGSVLVLAVGWGLLL